MSQNKLPEAVSNIRDHIFPEEKTPYRAGRILWIIRRYLSYAFLAAIHGYPVGPHRKGKFRLVYKYWDYIPWHLKIRLIFSPKASGYQFILYFDSKIFSKYDYYFRLDSKWKRNVNEIISTDHVYKLITEQ